MKFKYNIVAALLILFAIQSCSLLGDIDDIQPKYQITDGSGDVIIDESTAEMVLNGMYASVRNSDIANMRRALGGLAHMCNAISMSGMQEFTSGNVTEDNKGLQDVYIVCYRVINEANSFINNLELANLAEKELSTVRKEEMLSEARCMRAFFHMNLLRLFGQYNNMNSKYGIVLNEVVVNSNEPKARATVKDVYTSIMCDLDYAILHGPQPTEHWKISTLFAKALKARLLLTVGDYDNAASVAGEVLSEAAGAGYELEETYMDVFAQQFNSPEMLFAPYTDADTSPQQLVDLTTLNGFIAGDLLKLIGSELNQGEADERYVSEYLLSTSSYKNDKYIYPDDGWTDINSIYFMRLAEVYYIKAEAEARKNTPAGYKAAREALFGVIERVGYDEDYVNNIPDNQMLEMILKHKLVELNAENGEEWFDMVRYHRNGDFATWSAAEQKLLPSFNFCIFPIPRVARAGNNLLEQTPNFD